MKKEIMMNVAGVIMFYLLIVGGVIAINARMGQTINDNHSITLTK